MMPSDITAQEILDQIKEMTHHGAEIKPDKHRRMAIQRIVESHSRKGDPADRYVERAKVYSNLYLADVIRLAFLENDEEEE